MNDLYDRHDLLLGKVEEEKKKTEQIAQDTAATLERLNQLARLDEELAQRAAIELPLIQKRSADIDTWTSKSTENRRQTKEIASKQPPLTEDILHETLTGMSEEIIRLKAENTSLESKLESFQCLPPDITLAKVKIEETKRHLDRIEKEMETDIDLLGM